MSGISRLEQKIVETANNDARLTVNSAFNALRTALQSIPYRGNFDTGLVQAYGVEPDVKYAVRTITDILFVAQESILTSAAPGIAEAAINAFIKRVEHDEPDHGRVQRREAPAAHTGYTVYIGKGNVYRMDANGETLLSAPLHEPATCNNDVVFEEYDGDEWGEVDFHRIEGLDAAEACYALRALTKRESAVSFTAELETTEPDELGLLKYMAAHRVTRTVDRRGVYTYRAPTRTILANMIAEFWGDPEQAQYIEEA